MLVPCGSNDIANYISLADKLYKRHVYTPFAQTPPFLPASVLDQFAADREERERRLGHTLPSLLQRDMLEDYLRYADQVCAPLLSSESI